MAMNNAATPAVNALNRGQFREIVSLSSFFRVARHDGELAGFLIALDPSSSYQSLNYRWFRDRYDEFLYIDRVVVAADSRRSGVGRVLYADVQSYAEQRYPVLTCEVHLEPRNDVSLLFHSTIGFREVGVQQLPDGKTVSLLCKDLTCYEFVRERRERAAP